MDTKRTRCLHFPKDGASSGVTSVPAVMPAEFVAILFEMMTFLKPTVSRILLYCAVRQHLS